MKRDAFRRRREQMIVVSRSRGETKYRDSLEVYPINDARLLDIASTPYKMLLLATVYLKNTKKKLEHSGTELIALYKLTDTNTAVFVNNVINPRVSKYEIDYIESAYLFQLVFDNYEWRTLVFHMVVMDIPGVDSVIAIDEENKQLIIEKKGIFRSSLCLNFGYYVACLCYSLRMIQKKSVADLTTVKEGLYYAAIEDGRFVFRVKTSLPPLEDINAIKERYLTSLYSVIN